MDIQLTQLELNLFLNLIKDYLDEQQDPLTRLSAQISTIDI